MQSKQRANESIVTIAIPTYNRAHLLKASIKSALSQTYKNIIVTVLDNGSTDNTKEIVHSFNDDRLLYIHNEINLGMLSNWNKSIECSSTPFLVVLQDDDLLLPEFVNDSISKLEQNPNAAFSFCAVREIDEQDNLGKARWHGKNEMEITDGLHYLHMAVSGKGWNIHSSTVVMRLSALSKINGRYDSPHARHAFDFNLFVRLAAQFDVVALQKELVYVRCHSDQDTDIHWRKKSGTGPLGFNAERIDALGYLLSSRRAKDKPYREWLAQRLLTLNAQSSAYSHTLLPDMYWGFDERKQIAKREMGSVIPAGETFILVDEAEWCISGEVDGRHVIPFTSQEGACWGPPMDDEEAIKEIKGLQQQGVKFIVFGWPAFWWLEHYVAMSDYLYSNCRLIFKSSRLLVFFLI